MDISKINPDIKESILSEHNKSIEDRAKQTAANCILAARTVAEDFLSDHPEFISGKKWDSALEEVEAVFATVILMITLEQIKGR